MKSYRTCFTLSAPQGAVVKAVALALMLGLPRPVAHAGTPMSFLAGSWYPADAQELRSMLDGFLAASPSPAAPTNVIALIAPHAGYRFSGAVAGRAYGQVNGRSFKRVVVLGPTHRVRMPNTVSVPAAERYATPLGELKVDTDFVASLRGAPGFISVPAAHAGEHSVEIQLPFLQRALPGVPVVPLVVGQLDREAARRVALELAARLDAETLVVASSDFTHYGPHYDYVPFQDSIEEKLGQLDGGAYARIAEKDAEGFERYCDETGATVCGRDPIRVLLHLVPRAAEVQKVAYDTSGRITGDFGNSVSYMAVAFLGAWPAGAPARATLSAEDRGALLDLARRTLAFYYAHGRPPAPAEVGFSPAPGTEQVLGAFVTLQAQGHLRGCIGEIQPRRPIYQAVMERALDAAIHDRRFPPVEAAELPNIHIEISALFPPHPIPSPGEIVLGRHGVVMEKDGASAVFLPQVATEQGWTLEETLRHLSMKAGLDPEAWQHGARFSVFEAEVFAEPES